jgi:FixJ family two-component response regulator
VPSSLPIAVVDDDRSVREAIVMLLRSHGHAAMGFDSAEQFIQSFQAGKYGCLVSDVQMPGMDGPALAGWLAERDIHLPVVLMTARAGERLPALPANTRAVLRKPFACDALADILRTVMRPS